MRYLLHHGLQMSAEAYPARAAVVDGDRVVSYEELELRANQLARLLVDLAVGRGDRVGLYLDKSIEAVIGIYGTLKAGAMYVPMDPQAPAARLDFIARNCGVRVLLTATGRARIWKELVSEGSPIEHLVVLDPAGAHAEAPQGVHLVTADALIVQEPSPPQLGTIGLDLAYLLYTSGSTGRPKGVTLSHLNGLAFVEWVLEEFGIRPDDRLSSHAPFHFDLSILDVFGASAAAATLVLVPPKMSYFPIEVARFISRNEITVWYSVPSILNMLLLRGNLSAEPFPALRTVLFAGEVFPVKYLRRLMLLFPGVRFSNLYGPTETNVCTWYDVAPISEAQSEPIPIGRSIPGVEVFAVTEDGKVAGIGETGELHVRGPTVMQGYWGEPELTASSLVANPTEGTGQDLVYRTGDLVQQRPEGSYVLLGRRDHQVKSRGYRVELGEIEQVLHAHPAVVECVVLAIHDPVVTNRIRAYVVLGDEISESALVDHCASVLPPHMIPESFEFRHTLPRTSTGKIDRATLAEVDAPEEPGEEDR